MTQRPTVRQRMRPLLLVPAAVVVAGLVLAGCAGSSSRPSTAAAPASPAAGGFRGTGARPGASGTLAEIDGSTLEVQNPASGQISVRYTSGTSFSQQETVTRAAVKVGGCVTVIGGQQDSSAANPAPSSGAGRPTSFPARSVQLSSPVGGRCATGFGGRPGGFPGGRPSSFPSGFPSNRPSGYPSGRPGGRPGGFGEFASGTVSAISADSMRVTVPARGGQPASTDTITLTATTSYTEQVSAGPAQLRVGLCLTAQGKTDSTGALTATRISLSSPGPDGCTSGLGRRPGTGSSTGA